VLLKAALRRQQCSDVGKRSYDHFRIADHAPSDGSIPGLCKFQIVGYFTAVRMGAK
jgi:hypothetical protein